MCPLPTYNFTGSDEIRLDGLVDVGEHVPGIAYKVPDLEAFAWPSSESEVEDKMKPKTLVVVQADEARHGLVRAFDFFFDVFLY